MPPQLARPAHSDAWPCRRVGARCAGGVPLPFLASLLGMVLEKTGVATHSGSSGCEKPGQLQGPCLLGSV